jgi:hypothetical protein
MGWTKDANGNVLGDYNGEELCTLGPLGGCGYWNPFARLWQDRTAWILSEAGGSADVGVKAGMAVTAPQYLLMAAPVAAEAASTAYEAAIMNPDYVRGFAQGVSGGMPTMDTPQAFAGWLAGRAIRSSQMPSQRR